MKKLLYILSSLFLLVSCGPTELTEDEKNLLNQLTTEVQYNSRYTYVIKTIFEDNGPAIEKYITRLSNQKAKEAEQVDFWLGDALGSMAYSNAIETLEEWEEYCEMRTMAIDDITVKILQNYDSISTLYTDEMINSFGFNERPAKLSKQQIDDLCKILYKTPDNMPQTDLSDIYSYLEPLFIALLRDYNVPVVIKTEYVYEEEGWLVEYSFGDSYLVKFYEDEQNNMIHMKYEPVEVVY
jgi:hypothetical protein